MMVRGEKAKRKQYLNYDWFIWPGPFIPFKFSGESSSQHATQHTVMRAIEGSYQKRGS